MWLAELLSGFLRAVGEIIAEGKWGQRIVLFLMAVTLIALAVTLL